jgi:hypothetical protein
MGHAAGAGKLLFKFPGQGSFHANILREIFGREDCRPHFDTADRIGRRNWGRGFRPLDAAADGVVFGDGGLCPEMGEAGDGKYGK